MEKKPRRNEWLTFPNLGRMARVLRDPWYWLMAKEELKGTLERLAAFDVPKAGDMELASHFWDVVFSSKQMQGKAGPRQLKRLTSD